LTATIARIIRIIADQHPVAEEQDNRRPIMIGGWHSAGWML
jgi:hypothetical protein